MRFRLDEIRAGLKPMKVHVFPCLRSTSDQAANMRKQGRLYAPAVVVTARQTAGRGRGGNIWWSNAGVLTATFIFPVEKHIDPHQLALVAGLAVRSAAAELSGNSGIKLKWPNDVVFDGRKLAGLLCERVHNADMIGVGLNVNLSAAQTPSALRDRLVSLSQITGRKLDMTAALLAVGRRILHAMSQRQQRPFAAALREYDALHMLVGKRVNVTMPGGDGRISGRCHGLDSLGRLIVVDRGKRRCIVAGHIEVAAKPRAKFGV